MVPRTAMVPFHPDREPYLSYARNVKRFIGDFGVARAVRYWNEGIIPEGFKWLRLMETGYVDVTVDELPPVRPKTSPTPSANSPKLRKKPGRKPGSKNKLTLPAHLKRPGNYKRSVPKDEKVISIIKDPIPAGALIPRFKEPRKFRIIAHLLPPSVIDTFE